MRVYFAVLFGLVFSFSAYSQSASDEYSVEFIRTLLQSHYVASGFVGKRFEKMGDSVSIALMKVLEDQDLKDSIKIEYILEFIIKSSFSAPHLISIEEDKSPQASLILLKYLEKNIRDPKIKLEVIQSLKYVKKQTLVSGRIQKQEKNSLSSEVYYSVPLITELLHQPFNSTNSDDKRLNSLGDQAAIALIKILNEQEIKDSKRMEYVLHLIKESFAAPSLISVTADKKPKVTMLFLQYLRDYSDKEMKSTIEHTIEYVQKRT